MAARPNRNKQTSKADRHLRALQQAMQVFARGDHAGALSGIRAVLKTAPNDPQAHRLCALVLNAQGDTDRARFHAEKAVGIAPHAPAVHTTLGTVLETIGENERAISSMRKAVELGPKDTEALSTLAIALDNNGAHDEALALHQRALEASAPNTPARAHAGMNTALAMLAGGRARDAVDLLRDLEQSFPTQPAVAQRLVYCLNYDDRATRADINRAHRRWGALIEAATPKMPARRINPEGTLRVALVSPDLRAHSVASFVGPMLDHLDRDRFHLSAFFTSRHADTVTEALRPRVDAWHDLPGISDANLARALADDRTDIAIDLSGHFSGNRLGAFAQGPAPIAMTYLGYPATTGLTRIDARLVDSMTDPPACDDAPEAIRGTERLARLDPCFVCYEPPAEGPAPAQRPPSLDGAPFTFGSFNDLKKISPHTVALWSRVLTEAPSTRLRLKAKPLAGESARDAITRAFASRGVTADRLDLLSHSPTRDEHLATYNTIDLALDTYPYCGTTTTCESLWMGVPVLTRVGPSPSGTHASRVGLSLLTAAGLADLCATDDDAFVRSAVSLATDADRLSKTRADLRERFTGSPVCDARAFGRRFGDALLHLAQESRD